VTELGKLWLSFVAAVFLGVLLRVVVVGLIPEILSLVCWLTAIVIATKIWRLGHPTAELADEEANRIEEEKLARYGLSPPSADV
jgi:hypothetical protein